MHDFLTGTTGTKSADLRLNENEFLKVSIIPDFENFASIQTGIWFQNHKKFHEEMQSLLQETANF